MSNLLRAAALAATVVSVIACSGAGSSIPPTGSATPSGQPSPSSPSPSTGGFGRIEHPTGATDVILRYDEGGGLINPAFFATHVPIFTLYGDGTVLFRDPMQDPVPPVGDLRPERPLRMARLSEEQIQTTLIQAIGEGGLGTARLDYANQHIADAPTAVFTLDAGGLQKRVSVYALGLDVPDMPDAPARAAFAKLAARLAGFDQGGTLETRDYAPERYRGIVLEGQPAAAAVKPWPWVDLKPSDFVPPKDPDTLGLPSHVLTAAQVGALGVDSYPGGFSGVTLSAPDKTTFYAFSLRPLLPDETE